MNELKNNYDSLVELTDSAVSEIIKIKTINNVPDNYGLRLGIKSGGCCGLEYVLGFENDVRENDIVYESKGIKIIIDNNSIDFLAGATLDYQANEFGQGFVYHNLQNNFDNGCDCKS